MSCFLNKLIKTNVIIVVLSVFFVSCLRRNASFELPVEKTFKLDETVIGITTIASGLDVPWELAWGPDNQIWFTEQSGTVKKVDPRTGKVKKLLDIHDKVNRVRTLGMLGMAVSLHRDKPYVFIDYTHMNEDSIWVSRLVRYSYPKQMDTLIEPLLLMEIPSNGAAGHNGSRVDISKDQKIFWSTGEITVDSLAQDILSPNGKILRLNMDGTIPPDNPFANSPIWSLGHRNPQGLVSAPNGNLISSEHGDASDDELNVIRKSGNYGWPYVEGVCDLPNEKRICDSMNLVEPIKVWTPTIAPSGIDFDASDEIPEWGNSILMATLKDMSLRVLKMNKRQDSVISEKVYFKGYFGRIRDVCVSPEGDVYISTSNQDWNPMGRPKPNDDRIIRIAKVSNEDNLSEVKEEPPLPIDSLMISKEKLSASAILYQSYCASCHKMDGNGVAGTFPNLNNNLIVKGDKDLLINIVLKGDVMVPKEEKSKWSGEGGMPGFGFLKDEELHKIINFIRTSWENHSDSIHIDDIKRRRTN